MTGPLLFRFELRPVSDIVPWGAPGNRSLSWFGLSDGWQCLETAGGRLLEYTLPPPGEQGGSRWVDYQVVRLFEDLLAMWPWVSDPVPADVAARFAGWHHGADMPRLADDAEAWELRQEACGWWNNRRLCFGHLTLAPDLHLWRAGSELNLLWDARGMDAEGPRWAVQHARLTMPFGVAQQAVEDFCGAFVAAMADRVAAIERDGWQRSDCVVDVPKLVAEQRERETWPAANLPRSFETDWAAVRRSLDALEAE